jgi:hypothetical protein
LIAVILLAEVDAALAADALRDLHHWVDHLVCRGRR